jgi:hypothetical protein
MKLVNAKPLAIVNVRKELTAAGQAGRRDEIRKMRTKEDSLLLMELRTPVQAEARSAKTMPLQDGMTSLST